MSAVPRTGISLAWAGLARNLVAGARLAAFLPVRPSDFRVSAGHYAALVAASFALWFLGGFVQSGFSGAFDLPAFTAALAEIALLLGACVLVARLFGDPQLTLAFAVLLTSSDPLFEALGVLARVAGNTDAGAPYAAGVAVVLALWGLAVVARAQVVLTGWRGRASVLALATFAALMLLLVSLFPRSELWSAPEDEADDSGVTSIVDEDVFHAQGRLLREQLAALRPQRPGVADLYFVGVAADAGQDTFAKELASVRQLLESRFDTAGRSIALVNHPDTLARFPIASASNLRSALVSLGGRLDTENDIVLLHIATHGRSDHRLVFDLPPLELAQLSPTALARMLADSGIKWKVIVISACYSGGFIEPLKDANTLIITSADATHTSFGCDYDSEYTWFSQAFYDQALSETYSFSEAFERAARTVAGRERAQGMQPSSPQIFIGEAMRAKLAALERHLALRQKSRANSVSASDSSIVLVKGRK